MQTSMIVPAYLYWRAARLFLLLLIILGVPIIRLPNMLRPRTITTHMATLLNIRAITNLGIPATMKVEDMVTMAIMGVKGKEIYLTHKEVHS
jgi:hypothetical protein